METADCEGYSSALWCRQRKGDEVVANVHFAYFSLSLINNIYAVSDVHFKMKKTSNVQNTTKHITDCSQQAGHI